MAQAPSDTSRDKNTLYCNFCGKSQHEIRKLIASGDSKVFICDECTDLAKSIVEEADDKARAAGDKTRYTIEIKVDRPFSPKEQRLLPAIIDEIARAYPGCSISIK